MVMRRRKTLAAILRHLYRSGHALAAWIRTQGLTPENAVCYHYWFHNGLVITWLMETWANGIRLPQVARAHSGDLYHRDWNSIQRTQGIHVPFEQVKWKQADRVMTISEHGYRFVHEVFPQHINKIAVARLGVMDHGCAVRTMNRDVFVIVSCSLLSPNKRLNRLPEILEHVQMPVRWVHFGEGSQADREAIRRDIAARCPHVTVDFRGLVRNPEIIAFYQSNPVDLIVNLSFAEGIPVALMEAASFGVPMLATATVGSPEICNNENGILIPVEFDPAEVGGSIQVLMDNPSRWEEKSRKARATFETHYNAATNYSAFTRMLQSFAE
jgi:glycosyltransferase involved in cell wall biosynthesis